MFQFNVMMAYLIMVLVTIIALGLLSAWLRSRIARQCPVMLQRMTARPGCARGE